MNNAKPCNLFRRPSIERDFESSGQSATRDTDDLSQFIGADGLINVFADEGNASVYQVVFDRGVVGREAHSESPGRHIDGVGRFRSPGKQRLD